MQAIIFANNQWWQIANSSYIQVGKRINGRDMGIVSIQTMIGQAQVIHSWERQWLVNHRIDLRTLNEIY